MKKLIILLLSGILFLFISCAELIRILSQMSVQQPTVKLQDTKISGWSFDGVELNFALAVDNPNSMGIHLSGFDYELFLAENSFISGNQTEGLDIAANAQQVVNIPVQLTFRKIYETFQSLKNSDTISYQLKTGFSFDLPAIGAVRIPAQSTGSLPNLRIPSLKIQGLKLNNISFSGADLDLKLTIDNPNSLNLLVKNFNYNFAVAGKTWLQGKTADLLQISGKDKSTLTLPVKLSFSEMGSSLYQVLTGNSDLNYSFTGGANVGADNPLFNSVNLPFDTNGSLKLTK